MLTFEHGMSADAVAEAQGANAPPPPQWVRWEEQRKLQRRVHGLRAKLRVCTELRSHK